MMWIDYVIIAIISFSCFISLIQGLIREVLSLITFCCAFFVANYYYIRLSILFIHINNHLLRNAISISVLFFITLIVGAMIVYMMTRLIEKFGLSRIDKLFGMFFGFIRGILIVSIIVFFLESFTDLSKSQDWQKSQLIPKFNFIVKQILNYLERKF